MSLKPRTWLLISLLCFLGASLFWELGRRESAKQKQILVPAVKPVAAPQAGTNASLVSSTPLTLGYDSVNRFPEPPESRYPFRLHNSAAKLSELSRREDALLLANAMIDLRQPVGLAVPESLQLKGETESYIIQSRTKLDAGFRKLLTDSQAEVVSYVPNNALLIRVSSDRVGTLKSSPLVSALIPWIPYFKVSPSLLSVAINTPDLPDEREFRLVVFASEVDGMLAELRLLNAELLGRAAAPFGEELVVGVDHGAAQALRRQVDELRERRCRRTGGRFDRHQLPRLSQRPCAAGLCSPRW